MLISTSRRRYTRPHVCHHLSRRNSYVRQFYFRLSSGEFSNNMNDAKSHELSSSKMSHLLFITMATLSGAATKSVGGCFGAFRNNPYCENAHPSISLGLSQSLKSEYAKTQVTLMSLRELADKLSIIPQNKGLKM